MPDNIDAAVVSPPDAAALDGSSADAQVRVRGRTYYWTDWVSYEYLPDGGGTASGQINLPSARVEVSYEGELYGAQLDGGFELWQPDDPYRSALVDNGPPGSDLVKVLGVGTEPRVLRFSQPLTDPVLAVASLGNPEHTASCQFEPPCELLSQGPGHWGSGVLEQLPGNVLSGRESSGLIRFRGVYSAIRWTALAAEQGEGWFGFTVGLADPADGWDGGTPSVP